MNVVAINGSPHKDGVINTGLQEIAGELRAAGITVEIVQAGGELIHGCTGCGFCHKERRCRIEGDIVAACIEKVRAADGLLLGSPVYYGGIAGGFKCLLDRMFYTGLKLSCKAAAAIVSCRRSGGIAAYQGLCNYLTLAGAVIVPTVYWNIIHGNTKTEVREDEEGLFTMRAIGRNMAYLMRTLDAGKSIPPPDLGDRVRTNFIRIS